MANDWWICDNCRMPSPAGTKICPRCKRPLGEITKKS